MLKKFAPAGLVGLVGLTSLVTVILIAGVVSPVQAAAVKQGAACTKSGAKATSGKNAYVCQKNPTTAATKLVWITPDCATAAKTYLSTKKDSDTFAIEQAAALTKMKASIASWQNVVVLLDQKKAALETNLYPLWTDHTTKQMVKAQGITAAIAQLTGKIAEITAKRDNAASKATAAGVSVSDKANWTKAASSYTTSITTYTRNRDNLAKVGPKIDSDRARALSQVSTMQTQLDASTSAQDTLTTQIANSATQAQKYRDLACKAGI
jgi:hypothetical protein